MYLILDHSNPKPNRYDLRIRPLKITEEFRGFIKN